MGHNPKIQAHKVFTLPPRVVATYYWIQDFVKESGRFPHYYEIGEHLNEVTGYGSTEYFGLRTRGIKVFKHLEKHGFARREGRKLYLTDKQMSAENISRSTASD